MLLKVDVFYVLSNLKRLLYGLLRKLVLLGSMNITVSLVRFKKDLRVADHAPLLAATSAWFPVVGIFCFEPSIMAEPDWSWFHGQFMKESLIELRQELENFAIPLLVFNQEVSTVLDQLSRECQIAGVYAHEETWNLATYARDRSISTYLKNRHITFHEYPTNAIVRRLSSRDDRQWIWQKRMAMKPFSLSSSHVQEPFPMARSVLNLTIPLNNKRTYPLLQHWWIQYAHDVLEAFVNDGFDAYTYHVGRPLESTTSCSRLSAYLTYGNLSIKQVYQRTNAKRIALVDERSLYKKWTNEYRKIAKKLKQLASFTSRLHRHCHFIQKLESETDYELYNIHPKYDEIRTKYDHEILNAWKEWKTWYPLIDAAMRCLMQTGWINFRLRATIVSFICNTCMQPWQEPAHYLAGLFLDYEPWIHYPQFQMQSWTTGINQYRIYNPTKQLLEKDHEWKFIDFWVPELRSVPMPIKAEPWKLMEGLFQNSYGVRLWIDYPLPIVDLEKSNRFARDTLRALKKRDGFREIAQQIYDKHGSRKAVQKRKGSRKKS